MGTSKSAVVKQSLRQFCAPLAVEDDDGNTYRTVYTIKTGHVSVLSV